MNVEINDTIISHITLHYTKQEKEKHLKGRDKSMPRVKEEQDDSVPKPKSSKELKQGIKNQVKLGLAHSFTIDLSSHISKISDDPRASPTATWGGADNGGSTATFPTELAKDQLESEMAEIIKTAIESRDRRKTPASARNILVSDSFADGSEGTSALWWMGVPKRPTKALPTNRVMETRTISSQIEAIERELAENLRTESKDFSISSLPGLDSKHFSGPNTEAPYPTSFVRAINPSQSMFVCFLHRYSRWNRGPVCPHGFEDHDGEAANVHHVPE